MRFVGISQSKISLPPPLTIPDSGDSNFLEMRSNLRFYHGIDESKKELVFVDSRFR